ncbi:NAD(P)-dependent dehydrogenase (short-subunit alcohol dehydrogenase family) [Paenibacillus cellulosilyticus]|uniref:NAD(P)-dependent dehydrogenase (Short-subunit alcohol dehydrogenase family) n=1 Tax=Paenibacillus cellulosilyticus TaxID=375489 RepID=A0A2V2YMZ5_9BACL|nr:SDR family oxidoreductase [Paenibacillus cellulosilyticus]PWV95844.1 NAD(P)-dependent dehydrogenase (short-subunit alcohol dehydrogenase family) [Paenibacillus cellulosilyticus]QKS47720.1 SDR family oxidoreductase [Paenibacillus cellulosilyticus]
MNRGMKGAAAIVTGSTSGIGQSVAEKLAEQGVRVIVHGRNKEAGEQVARAIRDAGGEALFIQADLLDPDAPAKLVSEAVRLWGRIDYIVNNAALVCNKPIEEVEQGDWDRLLQVNLKTPFFLVQTALPWLEASKGAVVNVGSINGTINKPNNFIYDSIKASLNHMTRGLALDLRDRGIRVNTLMPGGVATPLIDQWFHQMYEDKAEAQRLADAEKAKPFMGLPEQIADAVVYLCGGGSSWINGAVIPIDGGYNIGI